MLTTFLHTENAQAVLKMISDKFKILFSILIVRCLKRYPLQVRHKQDWGRGFILLLLQAVVLPESDAGSDAIKPASGFVIQNCQILCSKWCPMYKAIC